MEQKLKLQKVKMFRVLPVLIPVILIILFDMIICHNTLNKYAQLVIEKTELFGENNENLKDFRLEGDGSIVSESGDPWIEYVLDELQYVESVDIIIDDVNPDRTYAQVFLILEDGTWITQLFYIHSGVNRIHFNELNKSYQAHTIRFDLVSQIDCSIKVDKIAVNSPISLTLKYHLYAIMAILFIIFAALGIRRIICGQISGFRELITGNIILAANMFLLCIYAPLDLYFNNKFEFWFDIYTLFPIVLLMFFVGVLIGSVIIFILFSVHRRLYQAGVLFLFITFVCSYIQGNFLVNNLPPLDGSSFEWGDYSGERIKSIILWLVVTLAVCVLLKYIHFEKMYRLIKYVSLCVTGMLGITLGIEGITTNGYQNKLNTSITVKDQFEMSDTENFIIIVLDLLDSGSFEAVMEYRPEYRETFSDFTFYPDTVGAYSFTSRSIPFILSGEWFENETPFEEYHLNVYKNAGLFSELQERDYKLGVYETTIPLTDKEIYRFENILECDIEISSYLDFIKLELMLTGFKYAPFDIKKYCVVYPSEFLLLKKTTQEVPYEEFRWDNTEFYERIQSQPITHVNQKSFKFIHIEGAHYPFHYDKDVNKIKNGTYEQNIEACMTVVDSYLDKLRASGSYDNSAIIIMSDHGYGGYEEDGKVGYGRQNPFLMIKGRDEHHEMQTSQAPVSYEDLQAAYLKLLDGTTGDNVFDWKEGDYRERRFLFYQYEADNYITEYVQTGNARDLTTLLPTGAEFNR